MSTSESQTNPYQNLYKRLLTPEELDEMRYNLVSYFEVLIQMDKQYRDYLLDKKKKLLQVNDSK